MEIKKIIIIGPFCSGTNLIENILFDNCYDIALNKNIKIIKNNTIYWKHTLNMKLLDDIIDDNTLVIVMYKHIYNWISSVCTSKYWLKFNYINEKVIFDLPIESTNTEKKFHTKCVFNNIIDLYNIYYRNYLQIKKNVIFVNYKKIIMDDNFDYLNNKLNAYNLHINDKNKFIKQLNKPSKNHGTSVKNVVEAKNKYDITQLKIKNLIELHNVNNFIDHELLDYFENF